MIRLASRLEFPSCWILWVVTGVVECYVTCFYSLEKNVPFSPVIVVVSVMSRSFRLSGAVNEDIHFVWLILWTVRWRHNGRDSVSNHQPHHCLLNRLLRRRSKKTSKLRVTGLCVGNSPGTCEFPAQMASNAENVSIWWHYHECVQFGLISWISKFVWAPQRIAKVLHNYAWRLCALFSRPERQLANAGSSNDLHVAIKDHLPMIRKCYWSQTAIIPW